MPIPAPSHSTRRDCLPNAAEKIAVNIKTLATATAASPKSTFLRGVTHQAIAEIRQQDADGGGNAPLQGVGALRRDAPRRCSHACNAAAGDQKRSAAMTKGRNPCNAMRMARLVEPQIRYTCQQDEQGLRRAWRGRRGHRLEHIGPGVMAGVARNA
ncbi:MAG: hypothetical protein ACYC97_06720 [Metallibacterium sp.]